MTKNKGLLYCLLVTIMMSLLCTKQGSDDLQTNNHGNPPPAPVISVAAGNGSAIVSWDSVAGADSFNLYYKAGASVDKSSGTEKTNVRSGDTITGLTNGSQYAFAVSAVGAGGESVLSSVKTATPQATQPANGDIGAAGGSIASDDSLVKLTVPQGALTGTVHLTTGSVANTALGGIGRAIQLGPEGTTFSVPATITFKIPDSLIDLSNLTSSLKSFGIAYMIGDTIWRSVNGTTIDSTSKTISFQTTHLSTWSLLQGAQIAPLTDKLHTNDQVNLEIMGCFADNGDSVLSLGYKCQSGLIPSEWVTQWSVNGISGGNATVGTISGSGDNVSYSAPGQKPSPNTVDVTAVVSYGQKGKMIVGSEITITDTINGLQGTIDFDLTFLTIPHPLHIKTTLNMPTNYDELDQANFLMKNHGTAVISPASWTDSTTGYVWNVKEASQPADGAFTIKKTSPLSLFFNVAEEWIFYYFLSDGTEIDVPLFFQFQTWDCTKPVNVFDTTGTQPYFGTFHLTCSPGMDATASWNLTSY